MSRHCQRVDQLRNALRRQGLEAFLATHPANVTYLTGFTGDSSYLLVGPDRLWLVTDSRYTEQAAAQAPACELVRHDQARVRETAKAVKSSSAASLGVEEAHLSYATYRELCEELDGLEPTPTKDLVETLRQVKDDEEIARIRRAVRAADDAFRDLRRQLHAGMTERQAASLLEFAMQRHGARKPSFESIVAARARASQPHAEATDAPIEPGDPVLVDWGAVRDHYCSDATRVLFLEPPDARWREVYAIVRKAQELAIAEIRHGADLRHVDAAARDCIRAAGYGENFRHGLGHGVGLEVHETPAFRPNSTGKLAEGMVVTVEPGIYLPGRGGVRIEDLVVVRQHGAELLTALPRDLESNILS